jgi:tetratricopeptide (TPR) repeat protein
MAAIALCTQHVYAGNHIDTMQLAKKYRAEKKLAKASHVLCVYHKNHPEDVNALWLLAQTEFWRDHYRRSRKLYKQALAMRPGNDYILLDYGKAMLELGDWKTADSVAGKIESKGRKYSDEQLLKAKILYWTGDYTRASYYLKEVFNKDAGNVVGWDIQDQLLVAKSPWLTVGADYVGDNQPIHRITPAVQAGIYLHRAAQLSVDIAAPVFVANGKVYNAQLFRLGDKLSFQKQGLELDFKAGVVKYPFHNKTDWTASFQMKEVLARHFELELGAEHMPYYYTLSSLDTVVNVNHFVFAAGWNDKSTWNGRAAFEFNYFNDKNFTYTGYAWLYAPPIKFSVLELRLGYCYSYSNSNESRFASASTLSQIIASYGNTQQITGVYVPYFTPSQQHIHAALLSLKVTPVKVLELDVKGNVGFYAYTQNPYLFLDTDSKAETIIARGFSKVVYVPFEVGASLAWHASRKIIFTAQYTYRSTYFFNSQQASVGLKFSFWNDKKIW